MALSLGWTNECLTRSWARGNMFYDGIAEGHMTQLPLDTLPSEGGETAMTMAVTLQDLLNMGVMYCVWQLIDPKSAGNAHYWYAIRVTQPFNLGHAGSSAYWEIATGTYPLQPPTQGTDTIPPYLWRKVVSEQALPYVFTASADGCPSDLRIELIPNPDGENLSIAVTISDQ